MFHYRKNLFVFGFACLLSLPLIVHADSGSTSTQPGSVDDPIITKSYFDQNIKQKVAEELGQQSVSEEKVKQWIAAELAKTGGANSGNSGSPATQTPNETPPVQVPPAGNAAATNLIVLKLESTQTLYGGQGTEFIVRTGKAQVVTTDDSGIADVTSGKDITVGQTAELNHLLIVPREGRGVKPVAGQKAEVYVMVRGNYLLMNADGSKAATP